MISNEFYTVNEICDLLKIKKLTVYRWIKSEKIKAVKIGKSFRIAKEELEIFLNQNTK